MFGYRKQFYSPSLVSTLIFMTIVAIKIYTILRL